jgi:Flp pilus assembly secretin CpaC
MLATIRGHARPALFAIVVGFPWLSASGQDPQQPTVAAQPAAIDIRPEGRLLFHVNQGTLLRLPSAATTLFIANAEVADAQLVPTSTDMVFVTARKAGATVLYVTDNAGTILLNKFVEVTGAVTVIRGAKTDTGEPPPGPMVLQIPLQIAPPSR